MSSCRRAQGQLLCSSPAEYFIRPQPKTGATSRVVPPQSGTEAEQGGGGGNWLVGRELQLEELLGAAGLFLLSRLKKKIKNPAF